MPTPITCLIGTYNEAKRLPLFLAHATKWADEIVITDKGSTDDTWKIACDASVRTDGKVRPCMVEFTPQGHEDKRYQFNFCSHDWVFLMTPGEIPTRKLIETARAAVESHGDKVDIITIPKMLYSFGIHDPDSPWSRGQQPFLVNRKRATISNRVHRNFTCAPDRIYHIPWSEDCSVYHPTHATVQGFLRSHFDYILAEIEGCADPMKLMEEASRQLVSNKFGNYKPSLRLQQTAWTVYWMGCMMAAHEKIDGRDVPKEYEERAKQMLAKEWQ